MSRCIIRLRPAQVAYSARRSNAQRPSDQTEGGRERMSEANSSLSHAMQVSSSSVFAGRAGQISAQGQALRAFRPRTHRFG